MRFSQEYKRVYILFRIDEERGARRYNGFYFYFFYLVLWRVVQWGWSEMFDLSQNLCELDLNES